MLALATVLISAAAGALADASNEAVKRARLNELRNRLGLQERTATSDLRSRIEYALKLYPKANRLLFEILLNADAGYAECTRRQIDEHGLKLCPWLPHHHRVYDWSEKGVRSWVSSHGNSSLNLVLMPPAGLRSDYEPLVLWLAKEMASLLDQYEGKLYDNAARIENGRWAVTHRLPSLLDWYESEHPDIMSMRWGQVEIASDAWHARFKVETSFRGPVPPGIPVVRFADGFEIHRLVTKNQLEAEGGSMAHCVGGYWPDVRDSKSLIFSLRTPLGDGKMRPEATMEIRRLGIEDVDLKKPPGAVTRSVRYDVTQAHGPEDSEMATQPDAAAMFAWLLWELDIDNDPMLYAIGPTLEDQLVEDWHDFANSLHGRTIPAPYEEIPTSWAAYVDYVRSRVEAGEDLSEESSWDAVRLLAGAEAGHLSGYLAGWAIVEIGTGDRYAVYFLKPDVDEPSGSKEIASIHFVIVESTGRQIWRVFPTGTHDKVDSDIALVDALLKAGVIKRRSHRDRQVQEARGSLLLHGDTVLLSIIDFLKAAKMKGAKLDKDAERLLKRASR